MENIAGLGAGGGDDTLGALGGEVIFGCGSDVGLLGAVVFG